MKSQILDEEEDDRCLTVDDFTINPFNLTAKKKFGSNNKHAIGQKLDKFIEEKFLYGKNAICVTREEAKAHPICDGFIPNCTKWVAHGEVPSSHVVHDQTTYPESPSDPRTSNDLQSFLHDIFNQRDSDSYRTCAEENENTRLNDAAGMFYNMIEDSEQELFLGLKEV
ncbi:hypothetical protein M9H77_32113 [Catharanthus roseus]|uniref:Uncharacterized protein n=1 Tax=Catharanthus roseus TaxID=4058 RepID=A0ACC0A2E0_CATRO|nr:hypothetical protein M9H77_32113 [Catharanthus roseus]